MYIKPLLVSSEGLTGHLSTWKLNEIRRGILEIITEMIAYL